jgi:membrane-associated phospholipid phosphatase
MKRFVLTLPGNIVRCFKGRMALWHLAAIILTLILVLSGFDWLYFRSTRSPILRSWMHPAVHIGGVLPIYLPLLLLLTGILLGKARVTLTGWAVAQAEIIGALISMAYKAVTGRAHPAHGIGVDLTHVFKFGFLRGGVFWGWPSSHTTIAFAMAAAVFSLFPKQRWLGLAAMPYAFYVGIGVSMTIHWFSDFVAGAIVGTVVGVTVGKGFLAINHGRAENGRNSALGGEK